MRRILILYMVMCVFGCQAQNEPQPNIVFILADDMGWSDLGCYGNAFNRTPHIDRLASNGMRFTDAYSAAPVCSPTRAAILSGQYPAHNGITEWIPGHWFPYQKLIVPTNEQPYLPGTAFTMAEMLQAAGYHTGFFGKWHLGDQVPNPDSLIRPTYPDKQGFDEAVLAPHPYGGRFNKYFRFNHFRKDTFQLPEQTYLTDYLTDLSLDFIMENKERPFFLYLSHLAVHNPLQAKKETIQKYKDLLMPEASDGNPVYAAMMEHLDEGVGMIMSKLDELGLTENTLVVFYSDNGGVEGYTNIDGSMRSQNTSNEPLRDQKGTLYEGGIRVPLILSWSGTIPAGGVSDVPISSVDFYPTFLELGKADIPPNMSLDGVSLTPLWNKGKSISARSLYWHYPHYHSSTPASAILRSEWKLIHFYEEDSIELYNLKEDIGEQNNLADQFPEKAENLKKNLLDWCLSVNAREPRINPMYDKNKVLIKENHPHKP